MNEAIAAVIAAILAAAASVVSNIILSHKNAAEMDHKLEIRQAVTDTKLEELTREVRKHNNFAERMPVVEEQIRDLTQTTNELRHYHMQ